MRNFYEQALCVWNQQQPAGTPIKGTMGLTKKEAQEVEAIANRLRNEHVKVTSTRLP
jgi:hypothetical protein